MISQTPYNLIEKKRDTYSREVMGGFYGTGECLAFFILGKGGKDERLGD